MMIALTIKQRNFVSFYRILKFQNRIPFVESSVCAFVVSRRRSTGRTVGKILPEKGGRTRRKTCSSPILCTPNTKLSVLESNVVHRAEMSKMKRLSHGTAFEDRFSS
jgi:hypothetical protein